MSTNYRFEQPLPSSALVTLQPVEGAFINLTPIPVDHRIAALLSYGPHFVVPKCSKLVDVVSSLEKLHWDLSQQSGVQDPSQFFREIYSTYYGQLRDVLANKKVSYMERLLLESLNVARAFFQDHPEICVVQADKGQRTVLMYKEEYKVKMQLYINKCKAAGVYVELLEYNKQLTIIKASYKGLRRQLARAYGYVQGMEGSRLINPVPGKIWRRLLNDTEFSLPVLYGTIKCHKEDRPMRPICASHSWYSNPIQGVICAVIRKRSQELLCRQNVRNITEVIPQLQEVLVCEGYEFVKYDVRDMYGSMDRRSVYNHLVELIADGAFSNYMSPTLLQSLIRFSLEKSSVLEYDGVKYLQVLGLPQGARDSGLYATIYLDHMIHTHYSMLFDDNQIVYWWKYMDDFLIYVPTNRIMSFKTAFERVTRLELEVEREESSEDGPRISFLDINIYRRGARIETGMYQKPCASMRMIHYMSACIPSYKCNTVMNLLSTILSRVSNVFLLRDLDYLERKLYANGYPIQYTRRYFLRVLAKEVYKLRKGNTLLRLRLWDNRHRIKILEQYMERFHYGSKELSSIVRRMNSESTTSPLPKRMSVYNFCSIEMSRFISTISRLYDLPAPVFRRTAGVLTAMRAVRAQGVGSRTVPSVIGEGPLRIAVVACTNCRTVFLISGRGNMDDVYCAERGREQSDLWKHTRMYGHTLSPTCQVLVRNPLTYKRDYSHLYALYAAMYNSVGIECEVSALRRLPEYLRVFFNRMATLPDVINLGLPMPPKN